MTEENKGSLFGRLKQGLSKTSSKLSEGIGNLLIGQREIDDELLEEMETQLITSDIGMDATLQIVENLTGQVSRSELTDARALLKSLQNELTQILLPSEGKLEIDASKKPYVILVVGVNGVGKTTTIGKMAKRFQKEGKSVMLAAGDTFRGCRC